MYSFLDDNKEKSSRCNLAHDTTGKAKIQTREICVKFSVYLRGMAGAITVEK